MLEGMAKKVSIVPPGVYRGVSEREKQRKERIEGELHGICDTFVCNAQRSSGTRVEVDPA